MKAKVAILDRDLINAERKAEEVVRNGGIALGVEANVLDKESLRNAHQIILEKFGPCDILLNGAGGNHPKGTTTKEYLFPDDLSSTPMNRFGEGEELVGTLLFLVNEEASSFVNGIIIPVDGGFSAYSGV
jgi:NAD(P)-dependent dehydrogenase (short-subunit alcohol dehydrogenase family)